MSDSSGRASSQYLGDKDPVRDSWALLVMPPRAHRFSSRGPPCVHVAEATLSPAMKLRAVRQQQFDKELKMQNLARRFSWLIIGLVVLIGILASSPSAHAQTAANPLCPGEDVFFNPGNGQDIVVPSGFTVSAFVKGLNFPTAVAFRGNARRFEVYVLESGHGLPSRCNDETAVRYVLALQSVHTRYPGVQRG